MQPMRRRIATVALAALLLTDMLVTGTTRVASAFDDEYVFAATRAVSDMDANPALKVTLFPLTVVVDAAFLPFAVVAGFVA